MVFPWIPFLKERKKRLSDIEFLAIKEFDGKLKTNTNIKDDGTTGDLATLTAAAGKDMYLAKAKVIGRIDALNTVAPKVIEVVLKANAVIKDRCYFNATAGSSGGGGASKGGNGELQYEFQVQGIKVAATQIIKLEVIASDAIVDLTGTLVCFEETTGDPPQV